MATRFLFNTMTTQLEMRLGAAPPAPQREEIEWFAGWLLNRPGFHPAKEISRMTGRTDRQIRNLAEHATDRVVSGPGSPGYCHIAHCPPEKLRSIVAAMRSQSRLMNARASRLEQAGHRAIAYSHQKPTP